MNLYISDLHFGHKNALNFDHRPFTDIDEMDSYIINMWNTRVNKDDDVYIVGDFAFRNERPYEWYLKQLGGRKHLIVGNHDEKLLKNERAMSYFESVDYILRTNDRLEEKNVQVILCHYPIAEWGGYKHGAYHIYGHIHNSKNDVSDFMESRERAFNVGCMLIGYVPRSLQELIVLNDRSGLKSKILSDREKSIYFVFNGESLRRAGITEDFYMDRIREEYKDKPIREIRKNYFVCDDSENALVFLYGPVHAITKNDHKFIEYMDECTLTLGDEVDDIIEGTREQYRRRG